MATASSRGAARSTSTRGARRAADGGRGRRCRPRGEPRLSTLIEFRFKRHFGAEAGKAGSTSKKSGRSALDLVIPVPTGTLAYRLSEDGSEALLADLSTPGERIVVAKGGRGGLGNQHYATSTRQAPRFAGKGRTRRNRYTSFRTKAFSGLRYRRLAQCRKIDAALRRFGRRGRRLRTIRLRRSNRNSASCGSRPKNRSCSSTYRA